MSSLSVTLIDVGWGDSILIESEKHGVIHYGLIDSNDTTISRSSHLFLKRHFEKAGLSIQNAKPIFDFVLLSHAHADHAQGLKPIMRTFGTRNFWYPKSLAWAGFSHLIGFARRSPNVGWNQAIDNTNVLPGLGDAHMRILWPPKNDMDPYCENNNSVVLLLTLNRVSIVLTGDAEAKAWLNIASLIPTNTEFFKVPHHGSVNGTFLYNQPTWLNQCPQGAVLAISSHVRPFDHPDPEVINLFKSRNRTYLRTDEHYHVTFNTDGRVVELKYSH